MKRARWTTTIAAMVAALVVGAGVTVLVLPGDATEAAVATHDHEHADDSSSTSGSDSPASESQTSHDEHGLAVHDSTGGREPTDEDRANADEFYDAVVEGIAQYQDLDAAIADGYVESASSRDTAIKHYMNRGVNGAALDPEQPSGLMYYVDENQATLLGAVWVTQADDPPQPGGPLTVWHDHSPMGCPPAHPDCPAATGGEGAGNPPKMFHVWTFEDAADAFAHDFPGAIGAQRAGARDGERPKLPFDV